MQLSQKTIKELQEIINERSEYRSGPKLIEFFKEFGFNEKYGPGFPSRWVYTEEKLNKLNGTSDIDKCIKKVFSPINFVTDYNKLDRLIHDFNAYLAYDKWQVLRSDSEIIFKKAEKVIIPSSSPTITEEDFLKSEFGNVLELLRFIKFDGSVVEILIKRVEEIKICLNSGAYLASIFLTGSCAEGILLGMASSNPALFNRATSAPKKKDGVIKQFHDWTLSDFIEVAREVGIIQEDVKKFSHSLREFRNYIHPYEQMVSQFMPSLHTAKISFQVLNALILQVKTFQGKN